MADLPTDPNAGSSLSSKSGGFQRSTVFGIFPAFDQPASTSDSQVNTSVGSDGSSGSTSNSNDPQPVPGPDRSELIQRNCLDPYVDVIYNVSLSMVSFNAVKTKLQYSRPRDLTAGEDYITFASTGEATTNSEGISYYNIQSLVFTNFLGHLPQNPMTAIIYDAKMRLVEPYGFSFREDLFTMSSSLGYDAVEPLNFTYRLEIWFSGYLPNGKWESRIKIPVNNSLSYDSIIYYIKIPTLETVVTPQGSVYDLSIVDMSHQSTRPEALIVHGLSIAAPDPPTFGTFLKNLAGGMEKSAEHATEGKFKPKYEFVCPTWLANFTFATSTKGWDSTSAITYNPANGLQQLTSLSEIQSLIRRVLNDIEQVRTIHLKEYDSQFIKPITNFNIRTEIRCTGTFKDEINGYDSYTYVYIIEPVDSFRSKLTEIKERNDRVQTDAQQQRVDAIRANRMLVREYDFLFTDSNSEVIDIQLLFKTFYQEPYFVSAAPTTTAVGNKTDNNLYDPNSNQYNPGGPSAVAAGGSGGGSSGGGSSGVISNAQKHHGLVRAYQDPVHTPTSQEERKKNKFFRSLDQYLRYDMMNAQLTVRGDPTWLFNTYIATNSADEQLHFGMIQKNDTKIATSESVQTNSNYVVFSNVDRIICLNAYRPAQVDFMNPRRTSGSSTTAPGLGGLYQVIQVANEFSGGKFVQKINMMKIASLQYASCQPAAEVSGSSTTGTTTADPATANPLGG